MHLLSITYVTNTGLFNLKKALIWHKYSFIWHEKKQLFASNKLLLFTTNTGAYLGLKCSYLQTLISHYLPKISSKI